MLPSGERQVQDFAFNPLGVNDYNLSGEEVSARLVKAARHGVTEEPYGGLALENGQDALAFQARAASTALSPWFESYASELMRRAQPAPTSFHNHPMACEAV